MPKKYYKVLIALIFSTLFLDMASTYGVATHLLGKGIPMQTVLGMERNPVMSIIWNLTKDIQIGVVLNYVIFSSILVIPLWYFSREKETSNSHSPILLAPLIVNSFFILGFVNNSLYLVVGQGLGNLGWNLIYFTMFLAISAFFLRSHLRTAKT